MNRTSSRWSVLSDTNLSIKNSVSKPEAKKQVISNLKAAQKSRNNSSSLSNTTNFSKNFNFVSTGWSDEQTSKVLKPQLTRKRHSKPSTTSIFLKNSTEDKHPPITQIYITHQLTTERSPRLLFSRTPSEDLEKYLNTLTNREINRGSVDSNCEQVLFESLD